MMVGNGDIINMDISVIDKNLISQWGNYIENYIQKYVYIYDEMIMSECNLYLINLYFGMCKSQLIYIC